MADWNEIIQHAQNKPRRFPTDDLSEFRDAMRLFNKVYLNKWNTPIITKAEARRRVREKFPKFI